MPYYLSMDGVDDKLTTPSMTYDEIIIDFAVAPLAWEQYINAGGKRVYRNGSNQDVFDTGMAVYIDGVQKTSGTLFITSGQRCTMRVVFSTPVTNTLAVFWNTSTTYTDGDIWDLKLYNSSVLQAHYDMTLGNVQDQSGNGRHATLTGGTWVQEGGGTNYNQSVGAATITPAGALGTIFSVTQSVGGATVTPSGVLANLITFGEVVGSAIVAPVGTIIKQIGKGVGSAIVTPAGNIIKSTAKTVGSAVISPVGVLAKGFLYFKTVGEAILTPAGAVEGVKMLIALVSGRLNRSFQALKNFFN